MAKQVKVSLKFEIEEVCLSIFHSSNLLILPMGLNFLKVYSRRKIMRAIFDCVKSNTQADLGEGPGGPVSPLPPLVWGKKREKPAGRATKKKPPPPTI